MEKSGPWVAEAAFSLAVRAVGGGGFRRAPINAGGCEAFRSVLLESIA